MFCNLMMGTANCQMSTLHVWHSHGTLPYLQKAMNRVFVRCNSVGFVLPIKGSQWANPLRTHNKQTLMKGIG